MNLRLIDYIKNDEHALSSLLDELEEAKEYIRSKYETTDLETLYILFLFIYKLNK